MFLKQIAIITCESLGSYTNNADNEDERLYRFLQEKGLPVSFQVWDDPAVDWAAFDALLIKSPWDYFDKADAFYNWLDQVEQLGCFVLNPVKTLRWNADKIYFRDLAQQGVRVVPSFWLEKGSTIDAPAVLEALITEKIIVKPRVSGGAKNTFALDRQQAEAKSEEINELLQQEGFLAQPFLEEIKTAGEWSFIFFGGSYSHAVLKTPGAGDFRVQHYLGGAVHTPPPPAPLLATAQEIVNKFASGCLYARVDGVEQQGELVLMELELIEPFLFLATSEGATERYYQALLNKLRVKS